MADKEEILRSDFRFMDRLRVRWSEIDAQKIVFNAHYLTYFDTAIAGYWRALAMPYAQTMAQLDGDLFVRKATVEYLGSARYDDVLDIGMRCARIGTSSIVFRGAAFQQSRMLVSCELVYVFADPDTHTSKPVPDALRAVLLGFEAGDSMVELQVGSWSFLGSKARSIRTEVFIHEQNIPAEMEWDEVDGTALHVVASNRFGMHLATGRLLSSEGRVARIGRVASIHAVRGTGVGRCVLEALIRVARERGDTEVRLNAQTSVQAFYTRVGFVPIGAVYEEAGIAHIEMARQL
jgi:YbgC/YbaW family acyl-CoA thioester hydrolase